MTRGRLRGYHQRVGQQTRTTRRIFKSQQGVGYCSFGLTSGLSFLAPKISASPVAAKTLQSPSRLEGLQHFTVSNTFGVGTCPVVALSLLGIRTVAGGFSTDLQLHQRSTVHTGAGG
jgi:hypothetical protein